MRRSRDSPRRLLLAAGALAAAAGWILLRPTAEPPSSHEPPALHSPATRASAPVPAPGAPSTPLAAPRQPPGPLSAPPDPAARTAAAALLAGAAEARDRGDLRATLELVRTAVERAPAVETHAALGALYLELGAASAAEPHLRAAAEGDPRTADRWIALANALALRPDPLAAAGALERARVAEPGLRVMRAAGGWLTRETGMPSP